MVSYLCPLIPAGVSVCLRYLIDFGQTSNPRIFTLSPSSTPLRVNVDQLGVYTLNFNQYSYNTLYMKPSIRFWSTIGPDIWSRFCFTLDSTKNVAQVFSGSNISIRKLIRYQVRTEECILNQQMNPAIFHVWKWFCLQVYRQFSVFNLHHVSNIYLLHVCVFSMSGQVSL